MKKFISGLFASFVFVSAAHAFENTSSRIEGVTEFLIDRANENYMYFFENSIRENTELRCYFPKTVKTLELAGLKELLLSNGLWKRTVSMDFEGIRNKTAVWVISTSIAQIHDIDTLLLKSKETLPKLNELNIIKGPLSEKDLEQQALAIKEAVTYFQKFDPVNKDKLRDGLCKLSADDSDEIDRHLQVIKDIKDTFLDSLSHPSTEAKVAVLIAAAAEAVPEEKLRMTAEKVKNNVQKLSANLKEIKDLADTFRSNDDYTVKTLAAFDLLRTYTLESYTEIADIDKRKQEAQEKINKIKHHVLFFAQVADSKDPKSTKGILEAYTLPAVSFFEKRDNTRHWFISAYLGLSATVNDNGVEKDYKQEKIFAPIGLEYSWGAPSFWIADSVSVMVAPFDFGYPVNLKLKEIEKDVNYNEIVAPSVSVNFGVRKAPIAWGIVWQRGKAYDASGKQDYRMMVHVSFDMPLHVF